MSCNIDQLSNINPEPRDKELVDALIQGLKEKSFQKTPHLVLLDHVFYGKKVKHIIARKCLTWMKAHHVFEGLTNVPTQDEMEEYVQKGNGSSRQIQTRVGNLQGQNNHGDHADAGSHAVQTLNLAYDWVGSFIPHSMSKVNRVSFGLLQAEDEELLGGNQPASRKLLGIPFVGKDVPSSAAEFAQPDVLIGATILAYRYEGLRPSDLKTAVRLLKESLAEESGPKSSRQSYIKFESWINGALSKTNERRNVLNLELFQLTDLKQLNNLYTLIAMEPSVIHFYLRDIVFPKTMQQQRVKISSSGQELGSDILFGRRLGFSGTPSNLLPVDIVPCHFERGSEGKILRCLTDNSITKEAKISIDSSDDDEWTVKGVLDQIAQSTNPPFHALIDTGALVTGYSNEEVARYLTDTGLKHLQGCVFLDHLDRKMIYLRGAARCIPLSECGLARGKRFTFYDQVHTTGMDIKQQISACACLTIGKDMIFRDYAQGAFRMRGIGKGQTIHLYIVPEIKKLIQKALPTVTGHIEDDVAAWLQLSGMKMEKLQFLQLCSQSMQTIWRKVALNNLISSSGIDGVEGVQSDVPRGRKRFLGDTKGNKLLQSSMHALKDVVNFDIASDVPTSLPYAKTLSNMVDENSMLVTTAAQKKNVRIVMKQVDDVLKSNDTGEQGKKGLNSEMTREKEREQEQQKQKQQQQQVESMFAKDNARPFEWPSKLLDAPPLDYDTSIRESKSGTMWENEFPFYPMSIFSPRPKDFKFGKVHFPKIHSLEFPKDMLQSVNFAPITRDSTKPLKLKNVNIVLDWIHSDSSRRSIVLTLSEAETMRRIIQTRRKYNLNESTKLALIVLPQGIILESTKGYDTCSPDQLIMASTKFWNNEMYYKEEETTLLLQALKNSNRDNRREFFEASLAARRRARASWTGTPVRSIFAFDDGASFDHLLALVDRVRQHMKNTNLVDACSLADLDGNGYLSHDEIMIVFEDVGVNQVSPLELSQLVSMMDVDGDNAIEYDEFVKLFSSNVPTSERAALLRTITAAGDGGGGGGGGGEKENDREMAERREREMVEKIRKKKEKIRKRKKAREEAQQRRELENEENDQKEREEKTNDEEKKRTENEDSEEETRRQIQQEEQRVRKMKEKQERKRKMHENAERRRRAREEREQRETRERETKERENTDEVKTTDVTDVDIVISDRREREESESKERERKQKEESERKKREKENEAKTTDAGGKKKDDDDATTDQNKALGPRVLDCKTIMSSEQSVNFFNLPFVDTTNGILFNGCYCCHDVLLPNGDCCKKLQHAPRPLTQDLGLSGRGHMCCVGCSFCLKLNADLYKINLCQGEHAVSAPCCKCGKAEVNFFEGQCCFFEAQACCLVHRCFSNICAPNSHYRNKLPDSLGIALLGYQVSPNSGCCKNMETKNKDGTSYTPKEGESESGETSGEGAAPNAVNMSR